jgi:uncharacterized cupin superfamily protein
MKILVIITGGGRILDAAGEATEFRPGDCLLVPAAYEGVMQTKGNTEYLTVTL